MLAFTRRCLAVRRRSPALRTGSLRIVEAEPSKLVFERVACGEHLRCTFNLSDAPAPQVRGGEVLISTGDVADRALGPYAALIEVIE